jgi:hypothetical protein
MNSHYLSFNFIHVTFIFSFKCQFFMYDMKDSEVPIYRDGSSGGVGGARAPPMAVGPMEPPPYPPLEIVVMDAPCREVEAV